MSLGHKGKVLLSVVALVAATTLALTGCSASTTTKASGKTTSVTLFNGSVGNFTENFNPWLTTGAELQPTQGTIYEALFFYNMARSQAPVPLLGTSYKWNSDGTQLTIAVRQGVKWSDGTALTADDVAYTLNRYESTPALNTLGATWTTKLSGNNVVLTFPTTSYALEPQILGYIAIVPKAIWSKIPNVLNTTNTSPVGSGPYMLKTFTPQSYTLTKNPNYWGTGAEAPAIDQVRFISLANADAATSALESGNVDWMGGYLPTLRDIVKQNPKVSYVNTADSTTGVVTCSNAALGCTGPQTDVAVRQAIYDAMDRAQFSTQALNGFGEVGSPTLLVPAVNKKWISDSANATLPQSANVSAAKQALEADGWTVPATGFATKGGKELDLTINVVSGWTDYDTLCTLLKGQLAAVGINLTVNQVAQNAWSSAETSGKFELSLNSVNPGASASPFYIYNNYLATSATAAVGQSASTNTSRFSDPAIDATVKTIAKTDPSNTAALLSAYGSIQATVVKQLPIIPIYVNQALTEFNNSNATGWPSASNLYAFPEPWKAWDNGIVLKTIRPVK
ncbi:MAG: ABC transporter substrate-binding protein [Acidobacteria bacterium]|nr:ABC transporter substrate-binding protein [Acidobacteriota bacterium]